MLGILIPAYTHGLLSGHEAFVWALHPLPFDMQKDDSGGAVANNRNREANHLKTEAGYGNEQQVGSLGQLIQHCLNTDIEANTGKSDDSAQSP